MCQLDVLSDRQPTQLSITISRLSNPAHGAVAILSTYVLIDQYDGNIFPFICEAVESLFDR
jgi:hypothetical protein